MNSTPLTLADLARIIRAQHVEHCSQLAALTAEVERLGSRTVRSRLQPEDAAVLREVLPLAFGRWPEQVFTSSELKSSAALGDELFKRALGPYAAQSAKAIGKLLARGVGQPVGGFVLATRPGSPRLWSVAVSNPAQTHQTNFGA